MKVQNRYDVLETEWNVDENLILSIGKVRGSVKIGMREGCQNKHTGYGGLPASLSKHIRKAVRLDLLCSHTHLIGSNSINLGSKISLKFPRRSHMSKPTTANSRVVSSGHKSLEVENFYGKL